MFERDIHQRRPKLSAARKTLLPPSFIYIFCFSHAYRESFLTFTWWNCGKAISYSISMTLKYAIEINILNNFFLSIYISPAWSRLASDLVKNCPYHAVSELWLYSGASITACTREYWLPVALSSAYRGGSGELKAPCTTVYPRLEIEGEKVTRVRNVYYNSIKSIGLGSGRDFSIRPPCVK